MNTSQLSRRKWRTAGFHLEGTESMNRLPGGLLRKHDLFNFADLVAINETGIVYVQTTSWSNVSARVKKILNENTGSGQYAIPIRQVVGWLLLNPNARVLVEGWKMDPKTNRYVSREVWITRETLAEVKLP
jgi:hypothetical protein